VNSPCWRGAALLLAPAVAAAGEPERPPQISLQPNVADSDETPAYIHLDETDMLRRVAVDVPREPARLASVGKSCEAATDALRSWERALAPTDPWFRLERVDDETDARIRIRWKRRLESDLLGEG